MSLFSVLLLSMQYYFNVSWFSGNGMSPISCHPCPDLDERAQLERGGSILWLCHPPTAKPRETLPGSSKYPICFQPGSVLSHRKSRCFAGFTILKHHPWITWTSTRVYLHRDTAPTWLEQLFALCCHLPGNGGIATSTKLSTDCSVWIGQGHAGW